MQYHSTVSFEQGRDLAKEKDVELGWLSFSLRCFDAQSRPDEVSSYFVFPAQSLLQCPGITLTHLAFGQLFQRYVIACRSIELRREWWYARARELGHSARVSGDDI
jgi:hypothetical protein